MFRTAKKALGSFWSREAERGKYAPIFSMPLSKDGQFPDLAYVMSIWTGLLTMIAHHFFYAYLDGKSIDSTTKELPSFFKDQHNVNFIGTAIAHAGHAVLTTVAGMLFYRLYWESLRSRGYKLGQIDALARCGQSPFNPSIFRVATTSSSLFIISLISSAMALIVVLTPGSLTLVSGFQSTQDWVCEVPTVPNTGDTIFEDISDRLEDSTLAIYASNSYLPPFRVNRTAACEIDTACFYNVTFVGPAFDCVDVTSVTDLSPLLRPEDPPKGTPYLIWDFRKQDTNSSTFTFFSQDLVEGDVRATNCTLYNATYEVEVALEDSVTQARVWGVYLGSTLVDNSFMSLYSRTALDWLEGTIFAGPAGTFNTSGKTDVRVQDNLFFAITPDGNHTWADSVAGFLTSYMQNISVSLLSGNIYYNISNDTWSNLDYVKLTCQNTISAYVYDSTRLFVTYGVAHLLVAPIGFIGWWLVLRNGKEGRPLLSRIVQISLNDRLFQARISGELDENTAVRLGRDSSDEPEYLSPLLPVDGGPKHPGSDTNDRFPRHRERQVDVSALRRAFGRWFHLTLGQVKMASLILTAVFCMFMHHAYNHHLNGNSPNSSTNRSHFSNWIRDQAVVSDVGLVLAYTAQTSLMAAVAIGSTQIFWWTLRTRSLSLQQIDSLMLAQSSPFSFSFVPAFRASFRLVLLAVLASSMALVSILSSSSLKVDFNFSQTKDCTVLVPQNMSKIQFTSTVPDYSVQIDAALAQGSYLPPLNPCNLGAEVACSYGLDFVGPGFDCQDVTDSGNATAFITAGSAPGSNLLNQFAAMLIAQESDLTMRVNVQTYDIPRDVYQAVNCTGVLRTYSTLISHNGTSTIDVEENRILSVVHTNTTSPPFTFTETHLSQIMSVLAGLEVFSTTGDADQLNTIQNIGGIFTQGAIGAFGSLQLNGSITWQDNMTLALEDFAQNATLSLLSGRFIIPNSNAVSPSTNLLENAPNRCTHSFTAYKYTPYRLFLTYGVAIFVTVLCAVWGTYAERRNGMEASMDFSRFLLAALNEDMHNAKQLFDKDTIVKATADGDLFPLLTGPSNDINMDTIRQF